MDKSFTYTSQHARTALALGELERSVMEVLWSGGDSSGVELAKNIGEAKKVSHNTVLTVLERLAGKGLVKKTKKGKFCHYQPKISKSEYTKKIADPLVKELLEMSSASTISSFVDKVSGDRDLLNKLKELIEENSQEVD
ncbi:MAG TPA: BlaI/MecI/CopY family transcriptional regulator [bacterium]|jgi:predicted transcriptional regulator